MVAPQPLEPLVLYLAATTYSASAALVAVREERQVKGAPCQAKAEVARGQEGARNASVVEGQAQQGGAAEAPGDTRVSGTLPPQDMTRSPQDPSLDSVPALVEHLVYFGSTVLRGARARYPMPQKLLLALLVAHASCDTTSRATPSRSSQPTHWRGYSGALTQPEGSLSGTSSCKHSSWSSALPGSSRGPHSLTLW